MTRRSASLLAALALAATALPASGAFDGFPLATNAAASAWYTLQDAHAPILQLWNAINERAAVAGLSPLGVIETNTVNAGWAYTNLWLGGEWYWPLDGPDEDGKYLIEKGGDHVWVTAQDTNWVGDILLGAFALSNRWPVTATVVTTNHFGAIEAGSVTGFPYVTRDLLSAMQVKLEALMPYYVYPGSNTSFESWWADPARSREIIPLADDHWRLSPLVLTQTLANIWMSWNLGYVTNLQTNAWGDVTGGDVQWMGPPLPDGHTPLDIPEDPLALPAQWRLYAYELDRIYHATVSLRWTARRGRKGVSTLFAGGTNHYWSGFASEVMTNDYSGVDAAAAAAFAYDSSLPFLNSKYGYPLSYSRRRAVPAYHPYLQGEEDTYFAVYHSMLIEGVLDNIPTAAVSRIEAWLGDYSTTYTNTIAIGYDTTATSGPGELPTALQFTPWPGGWSLPDVYQIPWNGNDLLDGIATMTLVDEHPGSTAETIVIRAGVTNLPAAAEELDIPGGWEYREIREQRGFEATDWIILFDWEFLHK